MALGDSVHSRILRQLEDESNGLVPAELARRLRISRYQVYRALRNLETKKEVRRRGSKWVINSQNDPNADRRETRHGPSRARTPAAVQQPSKKSRPHSMQESRWDEFRRLCLYYSDCIDWEQGSRVSTFAEKEDKRFVQLSGQLDWNGFGCASDFRIYIKSTWTDFLRNLRSTSVGSRAYVGGPIVIWDGKSRTNGIAGSSGIAGSGLSGIARHSGVRS